MHSHCKSWICAGWRAVVVGAVALGTAPAIRAAAAEALTPPPILKNLSTRPGVVEVELTAAPTSVSLLPGLKTPAYAYNGIVPGPLLEAREGDRVIVHFRNLLPEATTIHWHGLHIPVEADGNPMDPIQPGGRYDYFFTVPPGTAGTYWYHPHPHHRSGAQTALGLYGALIVRAADDPLAALPERVLVLWDNRFRADGAVDLPSAIAAPNRVDDENGREGNVLFVNGQIRPTLTLRAGEVQRWRVVNASAARFYRLALSGHSFLHVGSDGGLFERPVERDDILLAPSERVELLVRGTGAPGSRAALQSLPYDRYVPQTRPKDWDQTLELLTVRYSDEPPSNPPALPATLRAVPPMDPARATATRLMVLTQGFINNREFDLTRADVTAKLGATEIWQVENLVGMDHPFHLHGFRFQVLDRNGVPEPFPCWKDTVNVPRHQVVRFIVSYDDFPGPRMFHCHILDHEDHGMMGILDVR
jgi:FtsP/CotA-like multicopper oxidase with cupredoxin domain